MFSTSPVTDETGRQGGRSLSKPRYWWHHGPTRPWITPTPTPTSIIIHSHVMHGRSEVKTKIIGGVSWIQFTGVINWELSKAPGTMIPHRLSQMALTAMVHITRRELVILLINELMKYLFSIFVSYLFVYFSTRSCPQYFAPPVSHALLFILFSLSNKVNYPPLPTRLSPTLHVENIIRTTLHGLTSRITRAFII